jgi:hypothetical protein
MEAWSVQACPRAALASRQQFVPQRKEEYVFSGCGLCRLKMPRSELADRHW